ncbi:hypothetical protein [Streptomyces sp. NPDC093018]|uniref:hypothetical protein n=1 Tax=Streptomyces sp. NPDC093018 TaxID=3155067 RepID=UPI0034498C8B
MTRNAEKAPVITAPSQKNLAGGEAEAIVAQIRRRREASARCEPLPCGHRDPLDCLAAPAGPGTFGLTDAELRAEANRLINLGWQFWEVVARLAITPRQQQAQPSATRRAAA